MKKAPQFTTAVPAAALPHGQRAAKAAALPPHSRRCLPVLGLPYVRPAKPLASTCTKFLPLSASAWPCWPARPKQPTT